MVSRQVQERVWKERQEVRRSRGNETEVQIPEKGHSRGKTTTRIGHLENKV